MPRAVLAVLCQELLGDYWFLQIQLSVPFSALIDDCLWLCSMAKTSSCMKTVYEPIQLIKKAPLKGCILLLASWIRRPRDTPMTSPFSSTKVEFATFSLLLSFFMKEAVYMAT